MIIHTKFSLGDKVYGIVKVPRKTDITCDRCGGKGVLALRDLPESIPCTKCSRTGTIGVFGGYHWVISNMTPSTIGFIRTQYQVEKDPEIKYMINSTGIGTGTLWYEGDLFSTKKEALKACKKRNNEEILIDTTN